MQTPIKRTYKDPFTRFFAAFGLGLFALGGIFGVGLVAFLGIFSLVLAAIGHKPRSELLPEREVNHSREDDR